MRSAFCGNRKITIGLSALMVCLLIFASTPLPNGGMAVADDDIPAGNISVTAPSRIDFVAKADGTLIAPSPQALSLTNQSTREVRVSSLSFEAGDGWTLVDDASESEETNAVSLTVTPYPDSNVEGNTGVSLPDAAGGNDNSVAVGDAGNTQAAWTLGAANAEGAYGWNENEVVREGAVTLGENENTTFSWEDGSLSNAITLETVHASIPMRAAGEVNNLTNGTVASPIGTTGWYVVDATVTNDVYDRISALSAEVDQLKSANQALTQELATANTALATARSDISTAQSEISSLQQSSSYKPGSVARIGNSWGELPPCAGYISSSGTELRFLIPLTKPIEASSVRLSGLISVRLEGEYLVTGTATGFDIYRESDSQTYGFTPFGLVVVLSRSSKWTTKNNHAVSVLLAENFTLTFS